MNEPLLAAAPALLAICQELAECADYWSEYDVPIGIVERLNAVIAQAKGTGGEENPDRSCGTCAWYSEFIDRQDGHCEWDHGNAIPYIMEARLWAVDRQWGRKCNVWEQRDEKTY